MSRGAELQGTRVARAGFEQQGRCREVFSLYGSLCPINVKVPFKPDFFIVQ